MRLLIILSVLLTISACGGGITAEEAARAKNYCSRMGMDLYVQRYDNSEQAQAVFCRSPGTESLWKIPDSELNVSGRAHF